MEKKIYTRASEFEVDSESRSVQFVISTEDIDRHGTVIKANAWNIDNFNRNGIVSYQHNTSSEGPDDPDYIIGVGKAHFDGTRLIGTATFEPADVNPLADKIYKKIKIGTLRAASVGFIPSSRPVWGSAKLGENVSARYWKEDKTLDLIEFSVVNIPSNSQALKRYLADMDHDIAFDKLFDIVTKAAKKNDTDYRARLRLLKIKYL